MKKHNKQCTQPFFNEWKLPATNWNLAPIDWELCLPEIELTTWQIK
jgi:hypothetical protein